MIPLNPPEKGGLPVSPQRARGVRGDRKNCTSRFLGNAISAISYEVLIHYFGRRNYFHSGELKIIITQEKLRADC